MKKSIFFLILIILLSGSFLHAQSGGGFRIEGLAHYFQPSEDVFKDIYGSEMTFGGEINIKIWDWLYLWAGADFYNQTGQTTFTQEETKLSLMPAYGGLMFQYTNPRFCPYVAVGVGYFKFKEENPIGTVSAGEIGYIAQLGMRIKVIGPLFFDLKGSYSICKTQPEDFEVELGGIKGGIGIGLEF